MRKSILAAAIAVLVLAGCASTNSTQPAPAPAPAPAPVPAPAHAAGGWSQRMENQAQQLEAATRGTAVAVSRTPGSELELVIPSDLSFETGLAIVRPEFAPLLDLIANALRSNPDTRIRITVHTDGTGTEAIDDPLSTQRAAAMGEALVARGIAAGAIRIEGRGARDPVGDNATAAGREQNRRVEITVRERLAATNP
jgi:outer membrane protein OmpA-like peptidoglycan-associated protein